MKAAYFLEVYKRPAVKPSTLGSYRDALEYYIKPHIGELPLGGVRSEDVQIFYNRMFDGGLSSSTIKKAHAVLSQSFNHAAALELIRKNPCVSVVLPKTTAWKPSALTEDEQRTFTASCPATVYGDFFIFALNTGLRRGEIIALTWKDIDFSAGFISVNKNAYSAKGADGMRKFLIQTPKTAAGVRFVPINAAVHSLLTAVLLIPSATAAPIAPTLSYFLTPTALFCLTETYAAPLPPSLNVQE